MQDKIERMQVNVEKDACSAWVCRTADIQDRNCGGPEMCPEVTLYAGCEMVGVFRFKKIIKLFCVRFYI